MTVSRLVKLAENEVGTKECPPNSNNVKYNTWFYGHEVKGSAYPWCCAFVAWCFRNTGIFPKTASCANALDWFEQRGQRVSKPQVGDIVFFKFSTNARRTNHIGIVVEVGNNYITTIEGNTSRTNQDNGGAVMERRRDYKNIVAFARPAYERISSYE